MARLQKEHVRHSVEEPPCSPLERMPFDNRRSKLDCSRSAEKCEIKVSPCSSPNVSQKQLSSGTKSPVFEENVAFSKQPKLESSRTMSHVRAQSSDGILPHKTAENSSQCRKFSSPLPKQPLTQGTGSSFSQESDVVTVVPESQDTENSDVTDTRLESPYVHCDSKAQLKISSTQDKPPAAALKLASPSLKLTSPKLGQVSSSALKVMSPSLRRESQSPRPSPLLTVSEKLKKFAYDNVESENRTTQSKSETIENTQDSSSSRLLPDLQHFTPTTGSDLKNRNNSHASSKPASFNILRSPSLTVGNYLGRSAIKTGSEQGQSLALKRLRTSPVLNSTSVCLSNESPLLRNHSNKRVCLDKDACLSSRTKPGDSTLPSKLVDSGMFSIDTLDDSDLSFNF